MSGAGMDLNPVQKMAAARILIRDKFPYFRAALFGAVYKHTPGLNTMAMTERGVLMWDEGDVKDLTVDQTAASIMHELMHWLRDHAKRCRAIAANPRVWNYAADAEINDDVRDMGLTLPTGAKQCVFAPDLGCQDGSIAEVYYNSVRQRAEQLSQGGKGSGRGGEGDGGDDPRGGGGWCGSVAGRPVPQEPKGSGGSAPDQDGDADEGRSDAEAIRVRKEVAEGVVQHVQKKGRGSVPAGFLAWAEKEVAPPKVDWRTKLSKCLRAAMAYRPGCVTTTYTGFGRKQAALGYGVGKPVTPKWRSPVPRVAVAVDTSGSMGGEPLDLAMAEIAGILKAVNTDVEFLACDAAVHEARPVRTWQEAARLLKGGGGTDFRPVFDHVMGRRNQLPPEVLVFVTDGCGPAPELPPRGLHVIWVLVGDYVAHPCDWGDFVRVE